MRAIRGNRIRRLSPVATLQLLQFSPCLGRERMICVPGNKQGERLGILPCKFVLLANGKFGIAGRRQCIVALTCEKRSGLLVAIGGLDPFVVFQAGGLNAPKLADAGKPAAARMAAKRSKAFMGRL
jgi:hypothetical protein